MKGGQRWTGEDLLSVLKKPGYSCRLATEHRQSAGDRCGRLQMNVDIMGSRRNGPQLLTRHDDNNDDKPLIQFHSLSLYVHMSFSLYVQGGPKKRILRRKNFTFTRHKFLLVTLKEWLKSVLNYRSYPKNKTGYPFFWTTLYVQMLDMIQLRVKVFCLPVFPHLFLYSYKYKSTLLLLLLLFICLCPVDAGYGAAQGRGSNPSAGPQVLLSDPDLLWHVYQPRQISGTRTERSILRHQGTYNYTIYVDKSLTRVWLHRMVHFLLLSRTRIIYDIIRPNTNSWDKFKHIAGCSGFIVVRWKIFKLDIWNISKPDIA